MLSRSGSCGTTTSRDTVPWRRLSGTCSQLAGIDPGLPCTWQSRLLGTGAGRRHRKRFARTRGDGGRPANNISYIMMKVGPLSPSGQAMLVLDDSVPPAVMQELRGLPHVNSAQLVEL